MAKKPQKPAAPQPPEPSEPPRINPYRVLVDIAADPKAGSTARMLAARILIHAVGKAKAKTSAATEEPIAARAVEILRERMSQPGAVPTVGDHRGAPLHAWQDEARLETVRAEIDQAFAVGDVAALATFAGDPAHAPEARLTAWALALARCERAVVTRSAQVIDQGALDAGVAGLAELRWMDPVVYCSLLDTHERQRAARRETSIADEIDRLLAGVD